MSSYLIPLLNNELRCSSVAAAINIQTLTLLAQISAVSKNNIVQLRRVCERNEFIAWAGNIWSIDPQLRFNDCDAFLDREQYYKYFYINTSTAAFKKILNIENSLDEDDEANLQNDIISYTSIVNSHKYADSNHNTSALEQLLQSLNVNDKEPNDAISNDVPHGNSGLDDLLKEFDEILKKSNSRKNFAERLESNNKLLDGLQNENLLPGQPVYQVAKFGKDGGSNFSLKKFPIPKRILDAMESNNTNALDISTALNPQNYVYRFQTLLWIEEAHQQIEMRHYDQSDVMLARFDHDFFLLTVPGLAEGRPSLIRGDRLILRSDKRSSNYEGYIHEVRDRDIKIKLHESLHSTQMDGLKFEVSFLSSRTPFRRCHHGILQFRENPIIRDVVFPKSAPSNSFELPLINESQSVAPRFFMDCLNVFQREAVINVLKADCRPSPYIVFGPPGTGKTVTMVEAILQAYARDNKSKILVCGNSNSCADLIAIRINDANLIPKDSIVRVSAFYRMEKLIPPELECITMDMDMISSEMFSKFRIVITTCIQSGALYEFKDRFDYVFIDEAGHASEPEALISLGLLREEGLCVLAGDPHQLGPVVMSNVASHNGLGTSLLERLSRRSVYQRKVINSKMVFDSRYISKLLLCYRSDPRIMVVNNRRFYDDELKFTVKTPRYWLKQLNFTSPLVYHPVKGRDLREYVNPSWFNANEAFICLKYVNRLYSAGLMPDQLGIITPYRRQIEKFSVLFDSCKLRKCKIGTMEEFQGDERDIIIISTVRTQEKKIEFDKKFNLGFLFNPKRFNVAISRAKWLVIVVGDPSILSKDECWSEFMKEAQTIRTDIEVKKE